MISTSAEQESNQALFTASWNHIRKQGVPSVTQETSPNVTSCVYRNDAGLGCAFAPAIESYNPEMEGSSAAELLEQFPNSIFAQFRDAGHGFADSLQAAHDSNSNHCDPADFMKNFEGEMIYLAESYNLEVPKDE